MRRAGGALGTRCSARGSPPGLDPQAAYRVRYDGFRLLPESGNQYVLLSTRWDPATGVAVVLPRTDSIRLEFATAISKTSPTCRFGTSERPP